MTSLFHFDVKEKIKKIELKTAKVAKSANKYNKISNISEISNLQITDSEKDFFQERAAIREFDAGQHRLDAENNAIKDIEPLSFQDLNEVEQETLLDVFRTLLGWSKDLEGGTK